jgi:hypothetical protein
VWGGDGGRETLKKEKYLNTRRIKRKTTKAFCQIPG